MDTRLPAVDTARAVAGHEILQLTDRYEFGAYMAGWVLEEGTGIWRYVLSTPMLEEKGPAWVYTRLMAIFARHALPPGVTPLDIFVISPALEQALFGPTIGFTIYGPEGDLAVYQRPPGEFRGAPVDMIALYRRLPDERRGASPARTFDRKVRPLLAA